MHVFEAQGTHRVSRWQRLAYQAPRGYYTALIARSGHQLWGSDHEFICGWAEAVEGADTDLDRRGVLLLLHLLDVLAPPEVCTHECSGSEGYDPWFHTPSVPMPLLRFRNPCISFASAIFALRRQWRQ